MVFMSVLGSVHRPWVARLLTPYTICFGISMLASFVSFMSKSELRMVPSLFGWVGVTGQQSACCFALF